MNIETRTNRHRFIHYFEPPKGLVCSPFPVFSWAAGCPYRCHYCFLNLTLRLLPQIVVWTDYAEMERQIRRWAHKNPEKEEYLNAGELADSLALGRYSKKMLRTVYPVIEGATNKGIYLLTKSEGKVLLDFPPLPNVIVAVSVNAQKVSSLYEKGAPSPLRRLAGIRALKGKGFRVRIRIDPMLPIRGWEKDYGEIIRIINDIEPERVTLGTLRFNPSLPVHSPETDIWKYGTERKSGGKKRMDLKKTLEMYAFVKAHIGDTVSLCKETPEVYRAICGDNRLSCVCLE